MNLFSIIRQRLASLLTILVLSAFCCGLGLLFTFYLAPKQGLQAAGISRLPQMDAGTVESAEPGDRLLLTGVLADNAQLYEEQGLVAYQLDEWQVSPPDPDIEDDKPDGKWSAVEKALPDLQIIVHDQTVLVRASTDAAFAGPVREVLVPGDGLEANDNQGSVYAGGTLRYRGLANGDLVTVYGLKASSGGILPETLFAGDRVAFEEYQRDTARGLLAAGISMLVCAPVVLVGGGLAAVFGRRRRGLGFR